MPGSDFGWNTDPTADVGLNPCEPPKCELPKSEPPKGASPASASAPPGLEEQATTGEAAGKRQPGTSRDRNLVTPVLDAPPLVDLRQYNARGFVRGRPGWVVMLWWLVQAIAFPLTLHSHHAPRRALLRLFGAKVGRGVVIRPTARFTYPWKVKIDDYSWVGDDVVFYSLAPIRVGTHCVISQKTYLCTGSHDVTDPEFGLMTGAIAIGNGAWVAADCFIAPGVNIGANAVIGARSTVFDSMPAQTVCWGSPCQVRGDRQILPKPELH